MLTTVLLLAACGEDPPRKVRSGPGQVCQTVGTVDANPSPTLRAAVAPYLRGGERFRLEREVAGTATVLVVERGGAITGRVTLAKSAGGWAPTTVERCRPR